MRTLLPLVIALAFVAPAQAADPADAHPDLHLIPWPKSLQRQAGNLPLTAASRIVAAGRLQPLGALLAEEIATLTGLKLSVVADGGRAGDIVLTINLALKAGEPILQMRNREAVRSTDGAHAVRVGDRAVVEGFDYRAVAEGTATLLQLLGTTGPQVRLPKVAIDDWPHADYCGVMLDVARQYHPVESIQQVVRLCRLYKARYLQLHLTDDQGWTFPSTAYPKLGTKNTAAHGGVVPRVYKLDELKSLVAFADARGVTLVPEFEMPGHSGAALRAMPEIFDAINPQSGQPVGMGCMNMSNEAIYPALDTLIGELCDVFRSSPFVHIGSDEVTSGRLSLHPGYKAFLGKHNLKDEHQLADHFIAAACAMVKAYGKKAIKWEGLSNTATRDVIVMAWDGNSTAAGDLQARGYTTITCPWNLGVPWEEWNLYVCNGSRLKRGDAVLGATLVAWEQPPATHVANLRNLASRQERTWGPDTAVTAAGFAARFQPLDAVAGRLLGLPPKSLLGATVSTSLAARDLLEPAFAFDGNDATFFGSAGPVRRGDHVTVTLPKPTLVHAVEVLTGANGRGQLSGGEAQVSADGDTFTTVARLDKGEARAVLKDNRVRAVRVRAAADSDEPLVVREITLRRMVELSGGVRNPAAAVGAGNLAVVAADVEFAYPMDVCAFPVVNRGFTLKLDNGGNPCRFAGPISGTGTVELYAGSAAPLVLDGPAANTLAGRWAVKAGRVVLAKGTGIDAMAGTIAVSGKDAALVWNAANQINDTATLEVTGAAQLHLNGFRETVAAVTLAAGCKVLTDGPTGRGVLTVRELTVDGKRAPAGVYTSSSGWLVGSGYAVVGDVKRVEVAGTVADPTVKIGATNLAALTAAATFELPDGECTTAADLGASPLTLATAGPARFGGFLTGLGAVTLDAGGPLEFTGSASNAYAGATTLTRGVLTLNRRNAVAIPGRLVVGESATVRWAADGQIAPAAVVTLLGKTPAALDLDGHAAAFAKLELSRAAVVRTGKGGALRLQQLFVNGERLKDGVYRASQPWLDGPGAVTVDCRVDVKGVIGSPEAAIGVGNVGNLTGNTTIGYPSAGGDFDIVTNGFTLAFDSGNGNAFAYSGAISGAGAVEFYMGPSYTGFRDAPLRLTGPKASTATGPFRVKKGRVQLERPEGVDAISGDVMVGGQGFNDCLFWANSHQVNDTATITLLDAGNSGAAYLHLNGCRETVAKLTMTANNKVLTDSAAGVGGVLTVKALIVAGVEQPAGVYASPAAKWIEGRGRVVVAPR